MNYYKLDNTVKFYSIISYIGPLFILGRISRRRCNRIIEFHSWQGGVLFFTVLLLHMFTEWIVKILFILPIFSEIIELLLGISVFTLWVVLSIMGMVNAYNLRTEELPLIGRINMIMRNHYKHM